MTDGRARISFEGQSERAEASMNQYRIGVVGLGRIGQFHAETINELSRVGSLVVSDMVPQVTEAAAKKLGAEAAADPRALIASDLDGLVIASGTTSHPELILAGLEAGIPVFCEKPVAPSTALSHEVLSRSRASNVPVQIGHQRRFDPAFQAVRQAVKNGDLGWLHTIRSTTLDPEPPPATYIASSAGIFPDCGVHDFDAVRWISGQEVVEVFATGSNKGDKTFSEVGDVDTAAAILTLDDGTIALVSNSRYNGSGYDCRLEVHGSIATAAAGWDVHSPVHSMENDADQLGQDPHRLFMKRFGAAYEAEFEAFLDVIEGTISSPCTIEDAVEAGRIADAATLSLKEQRPVKMSEVRP
ncbi:myo-inositol 2-dehydrogenase / D-chiro-inositol 1-dehydrogenase [Marmoricola sp. URHA0025 HA25]